jgi:membrane protein YqaA with SNARE-associated domain
MGRIVARVQALAIALGAPGLFLVALLDSSILSLPEIADLLVVWMVVQHRERLVLYALSATLGSVIGCLALYFIGRKGGDALVRKRFHSASVDRTLATFQRYGVMAVLIPSLLPPPAPFKIFVLLAGAAEISATRFSIAVAIGRGVRYFAEALLALRYGEQAIQFMHDHGYTASLIVVAVLVVALAIYVIWRRVSTTRQPMTPQ